MKKMENENRERRGLDSLGHARNKYPTFQGVGDAVGALQTPKTRRGGVGGEGGGHCGSLVRMR